MDTIQFSTGEKEYKVTEKCSVFFNPTDSAFVEEIYAAFEELDKKQEDRKAADIPENEVFDYGRKIDREMCEVIDELFGDGTAASLFANRRGKRMSCYSLSDGLPLWANFMLSVIETIEEEIPEEQKKANPRLAKYTAKYKK